MPAFTLQARQRDAVGESGQPRFGLTVTRKTGTATERNRIRRRLREALRGGAAVEARPDHDYVIVARREALSLPFAAMVGDVTRAIARIHRDKQPPKR